MDKNQFINAVQAILRKENDITAIAAGLKSLWLKGETKTQNLVKKELREKIEHKGIAVEVLQTIGKEIGKKGKTDAARFAAIAELLWTAYGREGRIVAAHILSSLNEVNPKEIIPLCHKLVTSCVSWEECDTLTYGIEPVIRKDPQSHLGTLKAWLDDANKWVKRAALNVIARLPMKQPRYTKEALSLIIPCLTYADHDVRRTCSFAIRLSARGDIKEVFNFLKNNIGGNDATKIWIFSDAIRSMTKVFLPEFKKLLPAYRQWRSQISEPSSLKSMNAAISILEKT